jgi:hypothetical protein
VKEQRQMPKPLIVYLPAGDTILRREFERGVEQYADVLEGKSYTDAETVKLVLDIVGQGVAIAGGVAGILTFIRSIQQEKARQGQTITITIGVPGGPALPVEQADPELLARLLSEEVEP